MRQQIVILMRNIERRALLRAALGQRWAGTIPSTQGCSELDHALTVAHMSKPAVLLVDAEGFDGDGVHLLLKLRRECNARMVFVATGAITAELCHAAHEAGAVGVYGPADIDLVEDLIREILDETLSLKTVSGRVVLAIEDGGSSGDVGFGH